jgi:guanine deaminase
MTPPADDGSVSAVRGALIFCRDDPFLTDPSKAFVHEPDGLVICRNGVIHALGPYAALKSELPANVDIVDHSGCLIAPGFIDTHIHYVQTGIIGAQGHQLLDWLNHYTFVAEQAFSDPAVAQDTARVFCDELLRQGTTTALVFCSVHAGSVNALFAEAEKRNLRLIAGKVLMDRNAPAALTDTARSGYDQSKALIAKWHGRGRCLYAITPRYAGSSTPEQLELAGSLWREHPGTFVQTHIAENRDEVAWVTQLFPQRRDYLDIYAHYGLTGRRARFSPTGCIWTRPISNAATRPARRSRTARPRTSFSAAACSLYVPRAIRIVPSTSASARISAPGRAFRCLRP